MSDTGLVVLCTTPDTEASESLAAFLVENKFAACVNILPGIKSVYQWQGKIEQDAEQLLVIKTTHAAYDKMQDALQERHPYDTPEIIALEISKGLPDYLSWLAHEVS